MSLRRRIEALERRAGVGKARVVVVWDNGDGTYTDARSPYRTGDEPPEPRTYTEDELKDDIVIVHWVDDWRAN